MSDRKVTKTTTERRDVITLFVTVDGLQMLTRAFPSPWVKQGEPMPDPNHLGRQVEREFHSLCEHWGVSKASALTVYEQQKRTTNFVTETDIDSTEIIRNTHEHQEASA